MATLQTFTLLILVSHKVLFWVLPFLIFITDLPDGILSELAICANDTTVYSSLEKTNGVSDTVEIAADLEDDLRTVVEWGENFLYHSMLQKRSFFP